MHGVRILPFVAILVASIPLPQAEAGEANFPEEIEVSGESWAKLGEYRYVYRFFFPLYEAALYLEPGGSAEAVLRADCAYQLRFHYLREIEKSIILQSADKMLTKNLSSDQRQSIAEGITQLNEAYISVTKGDQSALTYQPGSGTTLTVNGEPKTTVAGQDFAKWYFQIWFGEEPISAELKAHLLGNE